MSKIFVYSNETGLQVASHEAETFDACLAWADEEYGSNDFHYSDVDVPKSNAVEGN